MIEIINNIFMALGMCVVAFVIYGLFYSIIRKFNKWRKDGCKIKCLCKPHKYELFWYWKDTEEAVLVCRKCGKRKQIFIDYDSIKEKGSIMKPEEAIKKLRSPELPDGLAMVGLEARQEAIKALEKQIPKNPNNIKSILDFSGNYYISRGNCPCCGEGLNRSFIYCDKCGQKLDWE